MISLFSVSIRRIPTSLLRATATCALFWSFATGSATAEDPKAAPEGAAPAAEAPAAAGEADEAGGDEAGGAKGAVVETLDPADCKELAALLSGRKSDSAAMDDEQLKTLAGETPETVTCGAVRADSDALCQLLLDPNAMRPCQETRSSFHELRVNPKGRGFLMGDAQMEACRSFPGTAPYCEKFRAAALAGDDSACADFGEIASLCRALITLDKSLCKAPQGELFEGSDEGQSQTYGAAMAADCVKQVQRGEVYAKGLKSLAESGPARERVLARAALGQDDACEMLEKAAVDKCASMPGLGGAPPSGDKAPPPAPEEPPAADPKPAAGEG
jgi:hypothetical protein